MLSCGARRIEASAAQPNRSTGRREPEVARRAGGMFRIAGCIREKGHDDGAGELQLVRRQSI